VPRPTADSTPAFPGYAWLLWQVLTARDRYRVYVAARRFIGGGGIVICDRYPLPNVAVMDGERTGWVAATKPESRLVRSLVALELGYYQRILPPDLLIILRVDPEIAVQRRSDEDPVATRTRNAAIWNTDWGDLPAHVVDAGQDRASVLAEVKSLLWSRL
jgi:thymidylate kinase